MGISTNQLTTTHSHGSFGDLKMVGSHLILVIGLFAVLLRAGAESPVDPLWDAHVQPLLQQRCSECHGLYKKKSGLDLSSLQSMLKGGDRGAAIVPGKPAQSTLIQFVQPGADPHMPPGKGKQLSEDEIGFLKAWIEKIPVIPSGPSASDPATNSTGLASISPAPLENSQAWTPPSGMSPDKVVDRFLAMKREANRATREADSKDNPNPHPPRPTPEASPVASDEVFLRRIHLDLVGRIPTTDERDAFLRERGRDKRIHLVDRLLASPGHARHFCDVFDVVLMGRRGATFEDQRRTHKWSTCLESAFAKNRPWDEFVRSLIVARPADPGDEGIQWFLHERANDPQAIAESVAPIVYGVQIKCAQCHDHMVAREIKQAHYWGTVAAFNRSRNIDTVQGPAVAESAIGGFVSFANLRKESQPAFLTFFNGRRVDEPRPGDGEKESDDPEKYVVPPPREKQKPDHAAVPKFSRRQAFAEAVTRDNPLLARAMVNRIWAMMMGRGIVHPVDLMDSKHPPSHPELLDWLARDFAAHGYDVRRLVRTLVLTEAYQRESKIAGGRESARSNPIRTAEFRQGARLLQVGALTARMEGTVISKPSGPATAPDPSSFARAIEKPLSAEQLYASILTATANHPDAEGRIAGRTEKELRTAFVKEFPDLFAPDYNATLQQAMFLSNSPLFDALLAPSGKNLAARMKAISDLDGRLETAFCALFGRMPDPEERNVASQFLRDRSTGDGIRQLLWAMLTSAEFQVNH